MPWQSWLYTDLRCLKVRCRLQNSHAQKLCATRKQDSDLEPILPGRVDFSTPSICHTSPFVLRGMDSHESKSLHQKPADIAQELCCSYRQAAYIASAQSRDLISFCSAQLCPEAYPHEAEHRKACKMLSIWTGWLPELFPAWVARSRRSRRKA